jgi:hypothetical protein
VQPSVKVVDLTSNTVTSSLLPFFGLGIAASATGDRLFVSTRPADQTSVVTVDPVAGSVISSALVRGAPQHLALAPPGVTPFTDPCTYDVAIVEPRFLSTPPLASPAGTTQRLLIMALPDRCAWTAESNVLDFVAGDRRRFEWRGKRTWTGQHPGYGRSQPDRSAAHGHDFDCRRC